MEIQGGIICRLCLKMCDNFKVIEGDIKDVLYIILPKIDLSIIRKPVICAPCHGSLEHCFRFVTNCFIVEENIKKYYETLDINSKDQIKLSDVLQFTIRDVTTKKLDGDLSDIIKVEEQLCEDKKILDEKEIGNGGDTVKLEEILLEDNEGANKDIENKKSFMEVNDQGVNTEQQFIPKNMLHPTEESNKLDSIKREEIFYEANDTKVNEENLVEMEDKKFLFSEDIEIKTDEHDFNRCEDSIVLSQSVTRRLQDSSKVIMYKCDSCVYKTKTKTCLKRHQLVHKNASEVSMYKCDSCSFQTKSERYLKVHLLVHKDPSEVTIYKCDSCLYQTKCKYTMKAHSLKHKDPSEVLMFKCYSCSYEAKHKSYLIRHMKAHKDPSEVTIYKCDSCPYQTIDKYGLGKHLFTHKDRSEVTMFKCDSCAFQTKYKKNLRAHSLTHKDPSEVTTYECRCCPYRTIHKSQRRRHEFKIHKYSQ